MNLTKIRYNKGRQIDLGNKKIEREREIRYLIKNLLLVDNEMGALVNILRAGIAANVDREHEAGIFHHWSWQLSGPR